MEQGVLVVSVDYRNFPQGTVSDMLQDVTTGVWWVQQNIHKWGVRTAHCSASSARLSSPETYVAYVSSPLGRPPLAACGNTFATSC